jgi:integrase
MSEIKKVPMTGKERSKKFYDENKEKERLRKSEYYKQKRILAGHPPPVPRKAKEPIASLPTQPTPPSTPKPAITGASLRNKSKLPIESDNELRSSSEFVPLKTIKEKRQSRVKGIKIKQAVIEPEPEPEPVIENQPEPAVVSDDKISALEKITSLINSIPNETKGNITFRINNFKTIIKILNTPNYKEFITKITSKPKLVIESIKEAEFRGKKYSTRSILAYFNSILFLLDKFPDIKITKDKKNLYKNQSDILNYLADEQGDEKKKKLEETGGLPSYDEYLNKVVETFGEDGREYLIAKLYQEIKARDDLILKVVKTRDEVVDNDNYLIINGGQQANVVINTYKTIKKYGEFEVKLSNSLTSLIRKYLKNNKISYNDYLFNSKSLSVIVGRMNKALGVSGYGATNVFRKMLQTDSDKSGASPEERLQLANELKHSMATAKKSYVIKKK